MSEVHITRRDFIKLAGLGAAAFLAPPVLRMLSAESLLDNKKLSNVEVYGAEVPVRNIQEFQSLMSIYDQKLMEELGYLSSEFNGKKNEDIKEVILPREKRYLTGIIRKSAFDSYAKKSKETGIDYPTWLRLHVDYVNRAFADSDVRCDLRIDLRRVVVVDDNFEDSIPSGTDCVNTDFFWFDNEDYRDKILSDNRFDYFWNYQTLLNGNVEFTTQNIFSDYSDRQELPVQEDLFLKIKKGVVDAGLGHEWLHLGGNAPDPYTHDVKHNASTMGFRMNNWDFIRPQMDPYMAAVIVENMRRGIRGYYFDSKGAGLAKTALEKFYYYGLLPKKVEFIFSGFDSVSISRLVHEKSDYYTEKKFDPFLRSSLNDGVLVIDNTQYVFCPIHMGDDKEKMYPTTYRFELGSRDRKRELYVSISLMNILKIISDQDESKLDIKFYDVPNNVDLGSKIQLGCFVKNGEVVDYISRKVRKGEFPYASVELMGTGLTYVWMCGNEY